MLNKFHPLDNHRPFARRIRATAFETEYHSVIAAVSVEYGAIAIYFFWVNQANRLLHDLHANGQRLAIFYPYRMPNILLTLCGKWGAFHDLQ